MVESFIASLSTATAATVELPDLLLAMAAALISGAVVSYTYRKTHPATASQNFSLTLILLPAVISIIIMVIGSDVARAFSLAGAFSIIRFRSAPGEPKDIALILFSLAGGLAAGAGLYFTAILFTLLLCLLLGVLHRFKFGEQEQRVQLLQITVPEDLDFDSALNDVLDRYTESYELKQVKVAALGSLYTLQYEVTILPMTVMKEFMDELRTRNDNLNINLNLLPG